MKKILLSLFLLAFIQAEAKSVCLNMIVKNESRVIERCLKSVKDHIDYWIIVDTGSTDGTQNIIKDYMKDIPGELHQSEWVNFEHNRNEALQFAKNKGDYLLFIDADEQLIFPENYHWPDLNKDFYFIDSKYSGTTYNRIELVNNHLDWKWVGVLHEYLECPNSSSSELLCNVYNMVSTDGARSQDPDKFFKDAALLEKALEKDPNNCRYVFYLAQCYKDSGQLEKAIKAYEKRITMGGYAQEVFWSLYQIGMLQQQLGMAPEVFLKSYCKAYLNCPYRAEPLNRMASHFRFAKDYKKGYELTKLALSLPYPSGSLFIEDWVYSYNLLLESSIDAYWIGNYEESKKMCEQLLAKNDLPENVRNCVQTNLNWANSMIYTSSLQSLTNLVNSIDKEIVQADKPIVVEEVKENLDPAAKTN